MHDAHHGRYGDAVGAEARRPEFDRMRILDAPLPPNPTVAQVAADDPNARLNILAANGSRLVATTCGDTLSVLRREDGVVLASEPYDDDPRWQEVPDRHLVEVVDTRVQLTPLKGS